MSKLRDYLELVRFSHTVFALPFALVSGVLAANLPLPDGTRPTIRYRDWIAVLLCMVFARSAAMAFNRIVDRRFDAENPRTSSRHLPKGTMRVREAIGFCLACSMLFVGSTALFLPNPLPLILALPVLAWLLGYSYAKRFTSSAHLWLGVALALAPVCVWIAFRGEWIGTYPSDLLPAGVLAASVALWVTGFDIIYACQDFEFDRRSGLYSVPAKLGVAGALRLSALLHVAMFFALGALPWTNPALGLGYLYLMALLFVGALLAYQHWLVRPDDLKRVGVAFFQVNAVISLMLMASAAIDSWLG